MSCHVKVMTKIGVIGLLDNLKTCRYGEMFLKWGF